MLALLGNIGTFELVLIVVIAVLIFGKDLPQAASKAYFQVRKLRNAVDDLRRESGIDRELREIERTVREAEWEARRTAAPPQPPTPRREPAPLPPSAPPPPSWETGSAPAAEAARETPRPASQPDRASEEAGPDDVREGAS